SNVEDLNVGNLAIAAGEIPKEPIINRRRAHAGGAVITSAQQAQLLIEQRGQLVLKGEDGGSDGPELRAAVLEANRWIGFFRAGFVPQEDIKIRNAAGGVQERIVGGLIIYRRRAVHAEGFANVENGIVRLDEADAIQI